MWERQTVAASGPGGRIQWDEIGKGLRDICYNGYVAMESFVCMGSQVGRDVHLWQDLSGGASQVQLDEAALASLKYLRKTMD